MPSAPSQPGYGQELLGCDADRGARRAGAHAGRAALDARAHVALDRLLGRFRIDAFLGPFLRRLAGARAEAGEEPGEEVRLLRRNLVHPDHAIGAIALAIAAADAGLVDEDLAVRTAMDRVGRTIGHAMRMLAMPARRRHVQMGKGLAGLTIEAGQPFMRVGAGLLAIVAA